MKVKVYLFVLLSILSLGGCSEDSNEGYEPDPEPEVKPDPDQDEDIILSDNTYLMTKELISHVTKPVAGTTIEVDLSVKSEDLPEVGQVLLNGNISEKFPKGFLGKVTRINKTDVYEIETEAAALNEAFDKLRIKETLSFEPDFADTRGIMLDGFSPYINGDYLGVQYYKPLSLSLSGEVNTITNNGWTVKASGTAEGEIGFNNGIGFKMECDFDIDNRRGKKLVGIKIYVHSFVGINFALKGKATLEGEIKFMEIPLVPRQIPAGAAIQIVFSPKLILSAFVNASGEYDYDFKIVHSDTRMAYLGYKNGTPQANFDKLESENPDENPHSFMLKGTVGGGGKAAVGINLFNQDKVSAEVSLSAGPSISANLPLPEDYETYYDSFKDNTISLSFNGNGAIDFNSSLFVVDKTEGALPVSISQPLFAFDKEYYIFPTFENLQWDTETSTVQSNVKRDLFIPTKLNYALYDKDKNFQNLLLEQPVEYRVEKDFRNPFSVTAQDIQPDETYYVRPVVELPVIGKIKALPEIELSQEKDEVWTINALYDPEENSLMMAGLFDYQKETDEPMEYGFCYSTTNQFPTLTDNYLQVNTHDEGEFVATLSNVVKDKTYYYRAYALIGDRTLYGGVKSVETKEASPELYEKMIGTWKATYYNVDAYVPEEDEEKYGQIPQFDFDILELYSDGRFYYAPSKGESAYGVWGLIGSNLFLSFYDDEGSVFETKHLTHDSFSLHWSYPMLYDADAIFERVKE